MKQREKCSGRRGSTAQVHQKKIDTVYNVHHGVSIWSGPRAWIQFSFDGAALGFDRVISNKADNSAMRKP